MSNSEAESVDLRVQRSSVALVRAVRELLDSGEAHPSVTDVVARAGISRPTFYQHFGDLATLQRAAAREELEVVFSHSTPINIASANPGAALQDLLTLMVARIQDRRTFFATVMAGPAAYEVLTDTVTFLAERIADRSLSEHAPESTVATDVSRFLAAGMVWLLLERLGRSDVEPPADLAALNAHFLLAGVEILDTLHSSGKAHE